MLRVAEIRCGHTWAQTCGSELVGAPLEGVIAHDAKEDHEEHEIENVVPDRHADDIQDMRRARSGHACTSMVGVKMCARERWVEGAGMLRDGCGHKR